MNKLKDKVALITGGSSGIGFATAKKFIQEGAKVIITGRHQKELDDAITILGTQATKFQCDVSLQIDLDKMYSTIKASYGHIDILFANAGIAMSATVDEVSEAHFDQQFNINVKGVFFSVQKALPLIKKGGVIIVNSSIAGRLGESGFSVYSATKAAVRSFARCWSVELKDRKIRVNAISPGPIETPIFGKLGISQAQVTEFKTQLQQDMPLGRMGKPEEIANAVLFLASDDSSFITGIDLCVDGGLSQI